MALVWGGAACYNGHRVGDDFSAIGFYGSVATKKINSAKAWTRDEEERLRKLIVSNAPAFDIAADLALQLLLWEMSESMGNHDSEVVDASCVD